MVWAHVFSSSLIDCIIATPRASHRKPSSVLLVHKLHFNELNAKIIGATVVAVQLFLNIYVWWSWDGQKSASLTVSWFICRTCLVELLIIFAHIPHMLQLWSLAGRRILPIVNVIHSTERAWHDSHTVFYFVSSHTFPMQSILTFLKRLHCSLHEAFTMC